MGPISPLLLVLLFATGLAFAGIAWLVVSERRTGPMATVVACGWYLLVFAPLLIAFVIPDAPIAVSGSLDYAGAVPFFLGLWALALAVAVVLRRRPVVPFFRWDRQGVGRFMLSLLLLVAVWTGWLVSTELDFTEVSLAIVRNTLGLVLASLVGGFAAEWGRRRTVSMPGACLSVLAALAAATAASANLELLSSLAIGAIVGIVAALVAHKKSGSGLDSIGRMLLRANIVGAPIGLLSLGLLDRSRGFFFTGQPTLTIAQLVLLIVSLVFAVAVSMVLVLVASKAFSRER